MSASIFFCILFVIACVIIALDIFGYKDIRDMPERVIKANKEFYRLLIARTKNRKTDNLFSYDIMVQGEYDELFLIRSASYAIIPDETEDYFVVFSLRYPPIIFSYMFVSKITVYDYREQGKNVLIYEYIRPK